MVGVKKRTDESVDSLIKRFNAHVYRSGILFEYMENQYYKKPSTIKREKKNRAKFLQKIQNKYNY